MAFQRATRVAEAIKEEVGALLLHRIKDARVESARVSVTDVEVSGDLRHATIFVSILDDESKQQEALQGLKSASGYIRSEIGKSIKLRATPEIHFKLDKSLEHGAHITALLNRIKEEQDGRESVDD